MKLHIHKWSTWPLNTITSRCTCIRIWISAVANRIVSLLQLYCAVSDGSHNPKLQGFKCASPHSKVIKPLCPWFHSQNHNHPSTHTNREMVYHKTDERRRWRRESKVDQPVWQLDKSWELCLNSQKNFKKVVFNVFQRALINPHHPLVNCELIKHEDDKRTHWRYSDFFYLINTLDHSIFR